MEIEEEQIKQLESGRALDRLVGEHVMGFSMYHYDKDHQDNCYFMLLDEEGDAVLFTGRYRDAERETEERAWNDMPSFSTDFYTAWQVVERMKRLEEEDKIGPLWGNLWHDPLALGELYKLDRSEVCLRICKAALMTVCAGKASITTAFEGLAEKFKDVDFTPFK